MQGVSIHNVAYFVCMFNAQFLNIHEYPLLPPLDPPRCTTLPVVTVVMYVYDADYILDVPP